MTLKPIQDPSNFDIGTILPDPSGRAWVIAKQWISKTVSSKPKELPAIDTEVVKSVWIVSKQWVPWYPPKVKTTILSQEDKDGINENYTSVNNTEDKAVKNKKTLSGSIN